VLSELTATIRICLSSHLCLVFQWIELTSISICLSFLFCLLLQWTESTPNSSAFIVCQFPPPQKHRASSTSIGLTPCPLFIGLTPCRLHFLCQLRVLFLPWADFTPLPSCVGCVSTTSPRADTVTISSPSADCMSIKPATLKHRSLEYRATSNRLSTIPRSVLTTPPPATCVLSTRSVSTTPFPTICVSTTRLSRPPLLVSTTC